MSGIARDFRYAFRVLSHAPGFTAIALLTLALGIGANTAMFAVVNAVLLKRLPFKDPGELMLVHLTVSDQDAARFGGAQTVWSYPKYRTFADLQHVYGDLGLFAGRDLDLSGDGDPMRVHGEVITERYPGLLGIAPSLGRAFTFEEANREGGGAVAMIGHGLWTSRFAADPAAVGRTIHVNAVPFTIVGVLPEGFHGLNGEAQIWLPLAAFEPSEILPRGALFPLLPAGRPAQAGRLGAGGHRRRSCAWRPGLRSVSTGGQRRSLGRQRGVPGRVAGRQRRAPGVAGAPGRGRLRPADRVRQPDESRGGQGRGATPGSGGPCRHRRQPRRDCPTTVRRGSAARRRRRHCRPAARGRVARRGAHAAARRRGVLPHGGRTGHAEDGRRRRPHEDWRIDDWPGCGHTAVHRRGLDAHGAARIVGSGAPGILAETDRRAEVGGWFRRGRRPAACRSPRRARHRADCARADAAGGRGSHGQERGAPPGHAGRCSSRPCPHRADRSATRVVHRGARRPVLVPL